MDSRDQFRTSSEVGFGIVRSGRFGNTGVNPGLSRNCDQGVNLHYATARMSWKAEASDDLGARTPSVPTVHEDGGIMTIVSGTAPAIQPIRVPVRGWIAAAIALLAAYLMLQENRVLLAGG